MPGDATANITIQVNIKGNSTQATNALNNFVTALGKVSGAVSNDNSATAALQRELDQMKAALAGVTKQLSAAEKQIVALKKAQDTQKQSMKDTSAAAKAMSREVSSANAGQKKSLDEIIKTMDQESKAAEGVNRALKPLGANVKKANQEQKASLDALVKSFLAESSAIAKVSAAEKKLADDKAKEVARQNALSKALDYYVKELQKEKQYLGSSRGNRAKDLLQEMIALQKVRDAAKAAGKEFALDVAGMQKFDNAVKDIQASAKRFGTEMHGVSGRLTEYEQRMDAIFRASYRFKQVGSDLQRVAGSIFNGFKNLMGSFEQFDFNTRRAAGALGLFGANAKIDGVDSLDALTEASIRAAENIKILPLDEVAKGFYYWGSQTGQVITSMADLNELVAGHASILKAASMTEVDFETALKGVYSVITQFYGGNLSKVTDVTEQLFYITQKTAAEFGDLINSFKMVGPVAASLGVRFEDVVTVLGDLADIGMRGTMAGRAIRQIFIQLIKPSKEARDALNDAFSAMDKGTKDLNGKSLSEFNDYYDAIFGKNGKYQGITYQIDLLAKMTLNMTEAQKEHLLGLMSTANSVPVLMALVNKRVVEIRNNITASTKLNLADAHAVFEANVKLLQDSWRGVIGSVKRAWEGLKVTVGTTVAATFTPLLDTIKTIIDRLREWANANPDLVASLAKMASVVAVFTGLGGAILTITGALMGLAAAAYVAWGAFFKSVEPVINTIKDADGAIIGMIEDTSKMGSGFGAAAKAGLGALTAGLTVLIALIEAVSRNFEYISARINEAFKVLSDQAGGARTVLSSLIEALQTIQDGVNAVFDVIVRRFADMILVVAQVLDALGKIVSFITSFGNLIKPLVDLHDAFDAILKVIGALIAIGIINKFLALVPVIGSLNAAFTKWAVGASEAALATVGLSAAEEGASVATRALSFSIKALVSSTGIGLLLVGLSLLVEAVTSSSHTLEDLKNQTDQTASAFGDLADAAEMSARRVAYSIVQAQNAAKLQAIRDTYGTAGPDNPITQGIFDRDTANQIAVQAKEFSATLEEETNKVLTNWKNLIAEANAKLSNSDYQIDPSRFMKFRTDSSLALDKFGNQIEGSLRDQISLALASIDPATLGQDLLPIYDKFSTQWGNVLGLSYSDFQKMVIDKALQMANQKAKDQSNWQDAVQGAIDAANATSDGMVSTWNKVLDTVVSRFDDVSGREVYSTVRQLLIDGKVDDNTAKALFTGLSGALDGVAEKLASSDFNALPVTGVTDVLKQSLTSFLNASIAPAMDQFTQIANDVANQVMGLESGGDVDAAAQIIYDKLFNTTIDAFGKTGAQMLQDGTAPSQISSELTNWLKGLVEAGNPSAIALSKAIEASGNKAGDNVKSALADYMDTIKKAFLDGLDTNIKKSFSEIRQKLKTQLAGKTDIQKIGQMLSHFLDPIRILAAQDTEHSLARQTALDSFTSDIQFLAGGIVTAIEQNHPEQAKQKLQDWISQIFTLPEPLRATILQNAGIKDLFLDPENGIFAQLGIPVPQWVRDDLTNNLEDGINTAVDAVKPTSVDIGKLIDFSRPHVTGDDITKGGAHDVTGGYNAIATQIANQIKPALDALPGQVKPAIDALPGAVKPNSDAAGASIANSIITAISTNLSKGASAITSGVQGLLTSIATAISNQSNALYASGQALFAKLGDGMSSMQSSILTSVTAIIRTASLLIVSFYPTFYGIGQQLMVNLNNGIGSMQSSTSTQIMSIMNGVRAILSSFQQPLYSIAQILMGKFADGLNSMMSSVSAIASRIMASVKNIMYGSNVLSSFFTGGFHVGASWANGFLAGVNSRKRSMISTLNGWNRFHYGNSPPKEGPLKNIDKGGFNVGISWAEGVIGGIQSTAERSAAIAHSALFNYSKFATSSPIESRFSSTRTVNINVDVSSKDGSVSRADQLAIREGVRDALSVAGLKHMVTVS